MGELFVLDDNVEISSEDRQELGRRKEEFVKAARTAAQTAFAAAKENLEQQRRQQAEFLDRIKEKRVVGTFHCTHFFNAHTARIMPQMKTCLPTRSTTSCVPT